MRRRMRPAGRCTASTCMQPQQGAVCYLVDEAASLYSVAQTYAGDMKHDGNLYLANNKASRAVYRYGLEA